MKVQVNCSTLRRAVTSCSTDGTVKNSRLFPPSWRRPLLVGVKAVHSLIYFSIEFCMGFLIYAGLKGREDRRTAIAAGVVAGESLIFVGNRCHCPLTGLAEALGATSGSVTDIYLPRWLASNLVPIHVPLLALVVGLHTRNFLRRPRAKVHSCAKGGYMKPVYIPESHRDLLEGGSCVVLTTVMPGGQPQTTPVWCNREGDYVLINTMRGFRKEKNMRYNPKVTLLAYDPKHPLHNIEIRGTVVEMTEEGALEHLDHLTQLYMHRSDVKFFGDNVPAQLQATYLPVKVKIAPTHIRVEG